MSGCFNGIRDRSDDDLVLWEGRKRCDVLGERFACYGRDIAVHETGCDEQFEDRGRAADIVEIFHEKSSVRGEVCKKGNFVTDPLDVVQGKGYLGSPSHGEKVKNTVCRTPIWISRELFNVKIPTHPRAIIMTRAFSNDSFVIRSRGLMFFSMHILMASAALMHSLILAGDSAGLEDDPGRQSPMASMPVDIVLAVYMPPQAPAPGHACRSRSSMTSLGVRPASPAPSAACKRP